MNTQRKQTLVLATIVALCHVGLLFAMRWVWQPKNQVKRMPTPVFARIITPQAVQSKNYSTSVPATTSSDNKPAETPKQATTEIAPTHAIAQTSTAPENTAQTQNTPQTQQSTKTPSKKRKQLWAPLPADQAPKFRKTHTPATPNTNTQSTPTNNEIIHTTPTVETTAPTSSNTVTASTNTTTPTNTPKTTEKNQQKQDKPTDITTNTTKPQPSNPILLTNPMDAWPASTRLRYTVGGNYRGKVSGTAQVQWIKKGMQYQSQVDMDFGLIPGVQMTSQGRIFPTGLQPSVFEEKQGVGGWKAVKFNVSDITIHDGRTVKNPEKRIGHMLDPAAQFVEFSHRFRTGALPLKEGTLFDFWLGRPEAIYRWQYSISGPMLLDLPQYGDVVVHHIKPTPLSLKGRENKGYVVEMWYAPELQYLPVRIKLNMGKEGYIDLMLNSVEQAKS